MIAITSKGVTVDTNGRLKIERCGGNEDCFEVLDHWMEGKVAPVKAELDVNLKRGLSEEGDKAKIVSKEEKRRQEKLEKERKKKEEEERRRLVILFISFKLIYHRDGTVKWGGLGPRGLVWPKRLFPNNSC